MKMFIFIVTAWISIGVQALDAKTYQTYVDCLVDMKTKHKDLNLELAATLCGGGSSHKIEVKDGVATITTTAGGKTTVKKQKVGSGEEVIFNGDGSISTQPAFKPSPFAQKTMGKDFNWSELGSIAAKELSDCVSNFKCDPKAYLKGKLLSNFHRHAIELSICVKEKKCDLNAYEKTYSLSNFHKDAMAVAGCVAAKTCDLEIYLATYGYSQYHKDALELSMCVTENKCDNEAYRQVYVRSQYHKDSIEVARCVKAKECDLKSYTDAFAISSYHKDALKISKSFALIDQNAGQVKDANPTAAK